MLTLLTILHRTLAEWRRRARSRRDIARLDERALADLGISSSQMAFEASKPFWRP